MKLPRWQKISLIVMTCLTTLMVLFDFTFFKAFFYNPDHIEVTYQTRRDSRIPSSLNQVSILYLTDLEYDEHFTVEKGQKLFETIKSLNPDVLLFGGDLFSWNADLTDEVRAQMCSWINSVKAPLGKFAVLGEQDLADENHRLIVEDVYYQSQVELLSNRSVLLANGTADGIRLGGLDVNADPGALAGSFIPEQFSLLLSHYPDNALLASQAGLNADFALCGNSHGTQITWPLFGGYKEFAGSEQINRSNEIPLSFPYYISSGVGCLNVQARLNSPAEIVYLTLTNQ